MADEEVTMAVVGMSVVNVLVISVAKTVAQGLRAARASRSNRPMLVDLQSNI